MSYETADVLAAIMWSPSNDCAGRNTRLCAVCTIGSGKAIATLVAKCRGGTTAAQIAGAWSFHVTFMPVRPPWSFHDDSTCIAISHHLGETSTATCAAARAARHRAPALRHGATSTAGASASIVVNRTSASAWAAVSEVKSILAMVIELSPGMHR